MLLEVKHIKKVFKTRFSKEETTALADIDFSVEEGEYIAIMGESGSGKTTLLNILSTLEKPTAGQVLLSARAQTHPTCLLYTSPSPRDSTSSRMPSSA